jgi:hypothetical protein
MADVLVHVEDDRSAVVRFHDLGDGTHAPAVVQVAEAFLSGRVSYAFYEFSIPTGASRVIKVAATSDTIVTRLGLELDLAALRLELVVGGTEGGLFSVPVPVFRANTMSDAPALAPQVAMSTGGTHTGGVVVDVLTAVSGANVNKAVAAAATEDQPLGFSAGTYYIRLINTDGATATGILRARWQERP